MDRRHSLQPRLPRPAHRPRRAGRRGRAPRAAAELALQTVQGTAAMRSLLRPAPSSSLNGPIGPHRRWDWAASRLSDVKLVRQALGGTINDVVLATISRGFRDLLLAREE